MHIFGAIVQSTMVQAAQAEWRKLAPADVSCVDQTLHQRGISLQALVNNGITPADSRISDVLATCRFQPAIQQTATPQFQPSSEPTRTVGQPSKYSVDKIQLQRIPVQTERSVPRIYVVPKTALGEQSSRNVSLVLQYSSHRRRTGILSKPTDCSCLFCARRGQ